MRTRARCETVRIGTGGASSAACESGEGSAIRHRGGNWSLGRTNGGKSEYQTAAPILWVSPTGGAAAGKPSVLDEGSRDPSAHQMMR